MTNLLERVKTRIGAISQSVGFASTSIEPGLAFRAEMRRAIPVCPACQQALDGHFYQQIASIAFVEGREGVFPAMLEAVRSHQWEKLKSFQEWEGVLNDAVVYIFRCPNGRYSLFVIFDPFELYESYRLIHQEPLQADDSPILAKPWEEF